MLIKMTLVIFLAFIQDGLARKCESAFSDTWCNGCQSGNSRKET